MMPSENCGNCGAVLSLKEQLMLLDVCADCEETMWPCGVWGEEDEYGGAADQD